MILGRIDVSARRLQGMLEDISNYMDLISSDEKKKNISAETILAEVILGNEERIKESGTSIQINPLPELVVYRNQLALVFQALLDNAIKFSKPGIPPDIIIYSETLKGERLNDLIKTPVHINYRVIHFMDNGIGFDNAYRDKMFMLFRRLHNNEELAGKGIGLAICQRVMSNHQGFIIADGTPGESARFMLFFPMD
jgi:light-regulated signal transduction histidine kinase (bacteriophytochrome)